jgi:perosamine synthetase
MRNISSRKFIPLTRPHFGAEELKEVQRVLDSGWVSQGPKVREFEARVAEYLSVEHAVSVVNCTAALHLSLLAIGVKPGDEVLVADYTFPATGHSVLYCGAKPVFVDVDSRTFNIDPKLIHKEITSRTKAIIPVHTFGQPAEMNAIMEIAEANDLKVIEDAACAFGASYRGRYAGTIGHIGCFSFHARKGITTGEGGMVVTSDKRVAEKIRRLSTFGTTSAWEREGEVVIPEFIELGYNYKMSDITAATGVAQLKKLDKIIVRKRRLAEYWDRKLKPLEWIQPPYRDKNAFHIYQSYVSLVDKMIDRNQLMQWLLEQRIQTQIGTYASHIQPIYNSEQKCPSSLDIFHRSLALPMYYALTENAIDFVVTNLEKGLRECLRR